MTEFETLYARDSKGRINEWRIETIIVNGEKGWTDIRISEGLINGLKTITNRIIKVGKNTGKMNETSAYEQAYSEAQSRWEKKRKQGYKSLLDLGIKTI